VRFDAARAALAKIPEAEIVSIMKEFKKGKNKEFKLAVVRRQLVKLWAPNLSDAMLKDDQEPEEFECSDAMAKRIGEMHQRWVQKNGANPSVKAKTFTVKKSTITLASQRVYRPARGQLTMAGSIIDGTAKMSAVASKSWLARKTSNEAIDASLPLTTDDIKVVLKRLSEDCILDSGTMARILLDESLSLGYVLYALDKKYVRGELIESDTDLSNIPLIGRLIVAPETGFVSYVADCLIYNNALALLGALIRSADFSKENVEKTVSAIESTLPAKAFSPLAVWQKNTEDVNIKIGPDAIKLAATMLELPPAVVVN
jgi:hypothetical protein